MPAMGQPGMQDSGASALERSLTALPESMQQAGTLLGRTEELKEKRQQAFDTLNATTAHQELRLELQPKYAEWRQGDWQTLPERVLEEGRELIKARAEALTPYGRALFEKHALETLTVFQQRALEERQKRTESTATFTMTREIQQGQEALASATNPYEVMLAQGQIHETFERMVQAGLADGGKAALAEKQMLDAAHDEQVENATTAHPDAMYHNLLAQSRKEATLAELPLSADRETCGADAACLYSHASATWAGGTCGDDGRQEV